MSAGACKYVRVAFNRLFRAIFLCFCSGACVFVLRWSVAVESSGHIGNETADEVIPGLGLPWKLHSLSASQKSTCCTSYKFSPTNSGEQRASGGAQAAAVGEPEAEKQRQVLGKRPRQKATGKMCITFFPPTHPHTSHLPPLQHPQQRPHSFSFCFYNFYFKISV